MLLEGKFGQELHLRTKQKFPRINFRKLMEKELVEMTIPATTLPKTAGAATVTTADLTTSPTLREPILEEKERARAKAKAEEATVVSRRKSLIQLGLRCSLRKIKVHLLKQELHSTYLQEVLTPKRQIIIPFS